MNDETKQVCNQQLQTIDCFQAQEQYASPLMDAIKITSSQQTIPHFVLGWSLLVLWILAAGLSLLKYLTTQMVITICLFGGLMFESGGTITKLLRNPKALHHGLKVLEGFVRSLVLFLTVILLDCFKAPRNVPQGLSRDWKKRNALWEAALLLRRGFGRMQERLLRYPRIGKSIRQAFSGPSLQPSTPLNTAKMVDYLKSREGPSPHKSSAQAIAEIEKVFGGETSYA